MKREQGSAVVPVQMEQKLLPAADGERSEKQIKKITSNMFIPVRSKIGTPLTEEGGVSCITGTKRV